MTTPSEQQNDGPREIYQNLLAEKTKRDEANEGVRKAIDEFKLLKEERDRINSEVAGLKAERNAKSAEAKKLLEEARALRDSFKGLSAPKGSSEALGKLIERLDFAYQTQPVPFERERKMVKKIEELKTVFRVRRFFERKSSSLADLSGRAEELFSSSHGLHQSLLAKAEEGEKVHAAVIAKAKEIDSLRKKADAAHAEVVRFSSLLGDARNEETSHRRRENAERLIEQETLLQQKAKKIKAELKGKKTFNLRDLQVLGAAGEEISFEEKGGASGKK